MSRGKRERVGRAMAYVGRVKLKLGERFRELGYTVRAEKLISITGYWRIYSYRLDHICWYAYGVLEGESFRYTENGVSNMIYFPSYDTMTDCARYGLDIDTSDEYAYWVYAESPKNGYAHD